MDLAALVVARVRAREMWLAQGAVLALEQWVAGLAVSRVLDQGQEVQGALRAALVPEELVGTLPLAQVRVWEMLLAQ